MYKHSHSSKHSSIDFHHQSVLSVLSLKNLKLSLGYCFITTILVLKTMTGFLGCLIHEDAHVNVVEVMVTAQVKSLLIVDSIDDRLTAVISRAALDCVADGPRILVAADDQLLFLNTLNAKMILII